MVSVPGEGQHVQRPSGEEARGTPSQQPVWTWFWILLLSQYICSLSISQLCSVSLGVPGSFQDDEGFERDT